jgi:hypothetical protein
LHRFPGIKTQIISLVTKSGIQFSKIISNFTK